MSNEDRTTRAMSDLEIRLQLKLLQFIDENQEFITANKVDFSNLARVAGSAVASTFYSLARQHPVAGPRVVDNPVGAMETIKSYIVESFDKKTDILVDPEKLKASTVSYEEAVKAQGVPRRDQS
jgi:hypothetical protein